MTVMSVAFFLEAFKRIYLFSDVDMSIYLILNFLFLL
jgi:hypothetical protein